MDSVTKSNKDSNCSCSSCIFQSESDRQSIRNLLALGSKIDRLYYGKYIPLREKKLLKRLVRTKAVYDDLRAQIVSDSTLSIKRKGKIVPRNRLPAKKSSTLLELANMRDQNGAFSSKNFSECCSCCSCSSKINTDDLLPKRYKRKQPYIGVDSDRYKAERGLHGGKKGVRFKAKYIRSDPCTCTFKLNGLLKKYSNTKFKRNRTFSPPPVPFDLSMTEENIKPKRSLSATMHQNIKRQKELVTDAFLEGVKKLSDSKTKLQEKVEINVKKSLEKLKHTVEKTIPSKKPNIQKDNVKVNPEKNIQLVCECPEKDLVSQIKKDSLIKFKDDLRKKHTMKGLECEPDCIEHTCKPEQCYAKLRQKVMRKHKPKLRKSIDIQSEMNKRTEMVRKAKKIQSQRLEEAASSGNSITIKTRPKKQKQADKKFKRNVQNNLSIRERNSRQAVRIGSSFSFNIEFYKNINTPNGKMPAPESRGSLSSKQSIPIKYRKYKHKKIKSSNGKRHNRSSQSTVNIKKAKKTRTTLKRCFCTLSFKGNKSSIFENKIIEDCQSKNLCNVPECKTHRLIHTQTDAYDEYVGDRLLESKHRNKKAKWSQQVLPRACDPGICIPDECDPFNCIKIMNMRHAKVKKRSVKCLCYDKTKSTSSLTTNYVKSVKTHTKRPKNVKKQVVKPKYMRKRVEKPKPPRKPIIDDTRQAVRIGSSFSFNIEFYKNKNPLSEQSTIRQSVSMKPKYKTKAQKKQKVQYKIMSKNQETSSDKHILRAVKNRKNYKKPGLNIDLKKCFCTLKLHEKKIFKNKVRKMHSTATATAENSYSDNLMLNRGTKMGQKRIRLLEPYECEPFVCVPGECDPYLCYERIKKRNVQLRDASAITKPDLREVSSTTHSEISSKFVQVRPQLRSKHEQAFTKAKLPNAKRLKFDEKFTNDLGQKQSVNIGSSFSFNIEFKKNRLPTTLPTLQYSPKRKVLKNKNTNNKILNIAAHDTQIEKPRRQHKSSMIRPLIKRCFCTLNLQKKHKQHLVNNFFPNAIRNNVYTVNRILTERTCHHYSYNKNNDNEIHAKHVFKNNHIMSVNNFHPFLSEESSSVIKNMDNKGTIKSLRMFQSTVQMLESVKINSKQICLNKSSPIHKNLALLPRKSCVTYTPNQYYDIQNCNNSNNAEETSLPVSTQMQQNHMSQYYKKYFCTMNIHIENKYNHNNLYNTTFTNKSPRKFIHPYECEPGICVPGQCDPYECIKMIMKRDKRYKSIENNTGKIVTQYGSSNTFPFASKSKSTKTRKELLLRKNLSENRQKLFDRNNSHVVRIGSNFSFDIEFFKNSKMLTNNNNNNIYQRPMTSPYSPKLKNHSLKPFKTLGTRMNEHNYRNMQSQSKITSGAHKGSATLPRLNRCFCTLKLHKKGKMYKNIGSKYEKPTLLYDQNSMNVKTASKSQNTKKMKAFKAPYHLQPYECEPNICDPDDCDPYQCLDIMTRNKRYKHVKNLGVDPVILNKNKSVYSLTTKNKSRGSQGSPYRDIPKTQQKARLGGVESNSINPSKQAVRIGSNFSFNIEFFKDSSLDERILNDNRHRKYISHSNNAKQEYSVRPTRFQEKSLGGLKLKYLKHKKSQVQNFVKKTSSMTSTFAKRCFCTAKLQRGNDKNIGINFIKHPNTSFLTKCLCWFKGSQAPRSKFKNKGINNIIKRCFCTMQLYNKNIKNHNIQTRTKSVMTEYKTLTTDTLLPYECEPGVCIPYQCDPHKCDKIIQARRKENHMYNMGRQIKPTLLPYECEPLTCIPGECNPIECLKRIKEREYQTKNLGPVARYHKYATSTTIEPYECEPLTCIPGECNPIECLKRIKKREYQTKNLGTVARYPKYTTSTTTKPYTQSRNRINQVQIKRNLVTPSATTKEVLASSLPNKQAVRIGSKFSFDIQFYKTTNIPDLKVETTDRGIRQIKDKPKKIRKIQKPQQTSFPPVMSQTALVRMNTKHMKNQVHSSDLKSFYKKCFCILKLDKFKTKPRPITKTLKAAYSNTDYNYNNYNNELSKQQKLLPYECEPGVCIPGLCDPIECEKRINKRNLKEFKQQTENMLRSKRRGTATMRKKSVKLQMSKSMKQKERQNVRNLNNNINKSVCRIGSEFSFNIEFFKNRDQKPDVHIEKGLDNEKHVNKINRFSNTKLMRNYASQSNMQREKLKNVSIESPLQRCFCTLKLKKFPENSFKYRHHKNNLMKIKPSQRSVMSNVTPANLNIPDKYDGRKIKSRDATSQVVRRRFDKSNGMKTLNYKKNIQTNLINKLSKQDNLKSNKRLIEANEFKRPFNKQALKIGSNVSFHIDFFKQRSPKTEFINIAPDYGSLRRTRDSFSKPRYSSSRTSQAKRMQSRTRGLQVNNVLKRCFCTLKLQDMKSRPMKKNIPKLVSHNYPQVVEVRRVSIQRQPKQIGQQTMPPIRTVATQSKNKAKKKKRINKQCPPCEHDNSNEMETILPYTPKKFNRSKSKTLLDRQQIESYHSVNKKGINKRLTRKKSHKGINIVKYPKYDTGEKTAFNMKRFFCQCMHLLSPKKGDIHPSENVTDDFDFYKSSAARANKSKRLAIEDVLKLCQNERCPIKEEEKNKPHTAKSKKYKSCSQTECPFFSGKYSTYDGDNENLSSSLRNKKNAKQINTKSNKVLTMKDYKRKRGQTKDYMTSDALCLYCQNKMQEEINRNNLSSPRLNVRFLDPLVTSQTDFLDRKKRNKKHVKSNNTKSKVNKRCRSCGRLMNTEEIRKGAGDYSETRRKHRKRSESSIDKLMRIFRCKNGCNVCDNENTHKPAFEMLLNSGNYNIINKDDVMGNFESLAVNKTHKESKSKRHSEFCQCCICISKRNKHISSQKRHNKHQPCVCGSLLCAEKNRIILPPQNKKSLWKPCVCGSPICNRESAVMKGIPADPDQITCTCQTVQDKEINKLEAKKHKQASKELKNRLKEQRKEDEIRRRKRKKLDQEREKQINKDSSDLVLCAESMIDISKLGVTACADVLRGVARIASNPRQAVRSLKDMKRNPQLIARNLKIAVSDSGVAGTIRRVRLRCLAMKGMKRLKRVLESFAVTNFLLNIAAKDPKKRTLKPKRRVRVRERLDFGCSLYMGSLRKRPYLWIYDRCPWIYPHFMSVINLYKQFRDILLFIIAIVFWSPCILCTEICRAMTCCIFCTG